MSPVVDRALTLYRAWCASRDTLRTVERLTQNAPAAERPASDAMLTDLHRQLARDSIDFWSTFWALDEADRRAVLHQLEAWGVR